MSMVRLRHERTGVIVSVPAERAEHLAGFEPVEQAEPAKQAPRKRAPRGDKKSN